jgi:hypothetical protein
VADLKPRERKTSDPARYARLGLEEPAEGGTAVRLTLRDATGQDIGGVVLGEELFEGGTSQRYVRTTAEPQAWLAEGRVSVPTDPLQWLEREIVRIPRDRVTRVTITHPDGEVVSIAREEGGTDYTLASIPEGRLPKSPGEVGAPASALSSLRLDDVRASSEPGFDLADPTVALYETDTGLKLTVETWQVEDQTWARLRADAPPKVETAEPADAGSEEAPGQDDGAQPSDGQPAPDGASPAEGEAADVDGQDADAEASDADAAAKEAEEINARVSGWLYAIPDYQATSLRKRLADLTAEPEPADPAEPAAEEGGEAPFFPSLDARDDPDDGG